MEMGYYGNDGFIVGWDIDVIFLGVPNWVIDGFFKKIFFNFGLKGVMEKCVFFFLVYLFFGGFFIKKRDMRDNLRKRIFTLFLMRFDG